MCDEGESVGAEVVVVTRYAARVDGVVGRAPELPGVGRGVEYASHLPGRGHLHEGGQEEDSQAPGTETFHLEP